jgi:hypothetical protein
MRNASIQSRSIRPINALLWERNAKLWVKRTPEGFLFNIKPFALMTQHPVEISRLPQELRELLPVEQRKERRLTRPSREVLDRVFRAEMSKYGSSARNCLRSPAIAHSVSTRFGRAHQILSLYTSSVEEHLAELAHHYGRSANPAKAVEYLTRAGQQGLNRSAFAEAQAQLQQGLE